MKQKAIFTLLLLAVATLSFSQADRSDTTKILFIGNSYTYYNSSPELLKGLAKEKFPNQVVETQLISRGGMTLERHWKGNRALQAIKSKDWDYVVLQEQSKMAMPVLIDHDTYFGNTDLFFEYARKFDVTIKSIGAETVFFMTWSLDNRPAEQQILTHAYTTIANELEAILSPVGLAWDLIRNNEQMNLYSRDGSHPSDHGSYLVASTLFSTLFEESPVGLSGNISGFQLSSSGASSLEQVPLVDIPSNDAKLIQAASWRVNQSDYKTEHYPEVKRPHASYVIPTVKQGEPLQLKAITGRWYGSSTYSNDYFGVIIDIAAIDNQPKVDVSMYSADRQDKMPARNVKIADNKLLFTITDSLRGINSNMTFSFIDRQLNGVSESFDDNVTRYKHWDFSKVKIQNGRNLAKINALHTTFQADIKKQGYVKAALNYYDGYSKLIGEKYVPSEAYLIAISANLGETNKAAEALNLLKLATTLYPTSVNAYAAAYNLAKMTNHKDLALIEANLKKVKANVATAAAMPSPPPPPRGGH